MHASTKLQRLSVILCDLILFGAAWYSMRNRPEPHGSALTLLLLSNAGLLIVDHIHFQYNGLLLGASHLPVICACEWCVGDVPLPLLH